MIACEKSNFNVSDCFSKVRKSIISGKGSQSFIIDYKLNRYACYLIVQNGNPRKEVIALAQTCFASRYRWYYARKVANTKKKFKRNRNKINHLDFICPYIWGNPKLRYAYN